MRIRKAQIILAVLLSFLLIISGCGSDPSDADVKQVVSQNIDQNNDISVIPEEQEEPAKEESTPPFPGPVPAPAPEPTTPATPSSTLKVHFIDVGQADAILIKTDESAVLVDAGNNEDGDLVVSYLRDQGVTKLSAAIATHPHEDHIGGMDTVLKAFPVEKFYTPNVSHTTKTFEDMIDAVIASGAKRIQAKAGTVLDVPGINGTFLAPVGSSYEDLNDYSAVLKITHGDIAFLLTGDAEAISENEMLKYGNLQSTVLKVGHHGSDSSTTPAFLKAVSPKYAVISVGRGNSYGHPSDTVLNRLTEAGVEIYRTDLSGTIVATTDGSSISFNASPTVVKPSPQEPKPSIPPVPEPTKPADPEPSAPAQGDIIVFKTKTGEKYHLDGCSSLSKSKIPVTLQEAKAQGLGPCSRCNPPQ